MREWKGREGGVEGKQSAFQFSREVGGSGSGSWDLMMMIMF